MAMQRKCALITTILLTVLVAATSAKANDDVCSASTLHGLYVFSATGYNVTASGTVPKAIVEAIRFAGDGTLTVPAATRSVNGTVVRSSPNGVGTYTVAPNCVGTISFMPGPTFDIFISPGGSEIFMIQTSDPTGAGPVLQGHAQRVWH
jgi:hypothetical protein